MKLQIKDDGSVDIAPKTVEVELVEIEGLVDFLNKNPDINNQFYEHMQEFKKTWVEPVDDDVDDDDDFDSDE